MKTVFSSVITAALLVAIAAPVQAQVPGIDLKLNPRIGLYQPVSDLGELNSESVSLESGLAIGLGAELQIFALPFGIRANLDYATGTALGGDGEDTFVPSQDATVLAIVGDLVFRPLPNIFLLQPYIFAGGGVKQYDFEPSGVQDLGEFQDTSDPTLHLGFGLDLGFGPLDLNAELGDYISRFESESGGDTKTQHDLFLTVGFAIGLL